MLPSTDDYIQTKRYIYFILLFGLVPVIRNTLLQLLPAYHFRLYCQSQYWPFNYRFVTSFAFRPGDWIILLALLLLLCLVIKRS